MTDDAALVAELRRLNGGLDAEWGDDEAFDTLKTKLWLHRTRLLDLAEEAIRLRASQMSPFGEAALKLYDENEALREQVETLRAVRDAAVERERGRVIGIFVGELQKLHEKTVLDCGDNSCLFATRRGGMRTNGGCRCIERLLDAAVAREREAAVYDFAAWLTTRKERLVLSSSDDAAPAAKAVQAYLRARGTKGEA